MYKCQKTIHIEQVTDDALTKNYNPVAQALALSGAPILRTTTVCDSGMTFMELDCFRKNLGYTAPVQEDAFLIALQLKSCPDFDLFADGNFVEPKEFNAGAVAIFDLRQNLSTNLRDPFHAVNLYLPVSTMTMIADDIGVPSIDELQHRVGTTIVDTYIRDMLLAMRPALAAGAAQTPALFIDHMAITLARHIASTYGGLRRGRKYRGGLAPWQERRAKELLSADLTGGISLASLAQELNISIRHLTRSFRQATGMTPHSWLLNNRIEKAKALLIDPSTPFSEVAFKCGFADQSHFIRAFSQRVGVTPGVYRRLVRG